MQAARIVILAVIVIGGAKTIGSAQQVRLPNGGEYGSPRFEEAIRAFEAADEKQPPPQDAVVCIGSSSIKKWHDTIQDDLAPLTIIPRGFGGSTMNEALYYAGRIVIPYRPRAVVIYEGDNVIAQGIGPAKIRDMFRTFVENVHAELPTTRIYFLSIKPSIKRWNLWPRMQQANRLIREECARDQRLTYVDVAAGMLDSDGQVKRDIFLEDNLHMNRKGYEIWRDRLRPVLIETLP